MHQISIFQVNEYTGRCLNKVKAPLDGLLVADALFALIIEAVADTFLQIDSDGIEDVLNFVFRGTRRLHFTQHLIE